MEETCARCGATARKELVPPLDWTDYLREQCGYQAIGTARIPLCAECYPEMDQLKNTTQEMGYHDEEDAERLREEIQDELDELDTDALRDTAL